MIATLRAGERTVRIGDGSTLGTNLTDRGIEGWYGTPDSKWSLTERQSGDGAHEVSRPAILYAARVVTMDVRFEADTFDGAMALRDEMAALAHEHVTLEVDDGHAATFAIGMLEMECDLERVASRIPAKLTIVCSDPRRYGTRRTAYLVPAGDGMGGLVFDSDANLQYPIQFAGEQVAGNTATISNDGTSPAYPIITASGSLPQGFELNGGFGQLAYSAPVGSGAPVVLDSLSETASTLGVDATRNLTSRDFPVVMPGESVTLSLLASGTGAVSVELFDTYV